MLKSAIETAMGMPMAIIKIVETPPFSAKRNRYHSKTHWNIKAFNFYKQACSNINESIVNDMGALFFFFFFLGGGGSGKEIRKKKIFNDVETFFLKNKR
jgi:hypothetical protein